MSQVEQAVQSFFDGIKPLPEGCGILVAVSGGADSMSLLHVLDHWRRTHALRLMAAHVHHGLRGAEADRDEAFVTAQCAVRQIPLHVLHAHVRQEMLPGEGIEAAGRRIRYAFFDRLLQQHALDWVATAHTADDALETVLLHMTRGSALQGLCGIPAVSGTRIRPLLACPRAAIEQYCREQQLSYVTDSTNADISYSRNRIRHEVVPALRAINPQVTAAAARMVGALREDAALLGQLTDELLCRARIAADTYAVTELSAAPPALLHRALKRIADTAGGDCAYTHIALLQAAIQNNSGCVQLPGTVSITVKNGFLTVKTDPKTPVPYFEMPLCMGQTHEIAGRVYTAVCVSRDFFEEKRKVYKKVLKFALDYDKISSSLYIRQRKPGDAFHPVNGVGKSLKKYLNERHTDIQERARLPLVCDSRGIVLLPGFSCDHRVRLEDSTARVLLFYPAGDV